MRRSLTVVLLLISVALTGCGKTAAPAPSSNTPAPASADASTPLPAGACTPGATAVDLPSGPYGSGITLKPPTPAGTPDRPWMQYLTVDQIGGGMMNGTVYLRKGGTATVDTGEIWVKGNLQPFPSADWYQSHMKLEGITPIQTFGTDGNGLFQLRLPAGRAGDSFRLTLKDVEMGDGTNGDVVVTFCRQAAPTATLSYKDKDGWHPAAAAVPTASGPLSLRITFSQEMLAETVERALKGPHDKTDRSDGDWITALKWVDARTVELTADKPQPVMKLNLSGAQDKSGLFVAGGLPNLYASDPPQVLAVDPASGKSSTLAALAPEPQGGVLSPDGKLLRVVSAIFRAGQGAPTWEHSLIDLTTGKAKPLKPEELYGSWLPSGDVVWFRPAGENQIVLTHQSPAGGAPQETVIGDLPPYDSFYVSPDGKWIAVLVRSGEYTKDSYQPVRFLIVSSDGKTRKSLTGDARMWRPGKDGIRLYGPAWSPDSTRIALTQTNGSVHSLVLADVTAGALRTLVPELPGGRGSFDAVTWSPDGKMILVGPSLVDATTGKVERRIEGLQGGMPYWSKDGQWLLFQDGEWSDITAYNLATSQQYQLGKGMALGWGADGKAILIRWPGSANRTIYGY